MFGRVLDEVIPDYNDKVDWIITNPPWSKIKEFMIHSMTIANEIVYLISINLFKML